MADKKMKGKLIEYCDEHSQASDSSSNPTSTEEGLEKEASETDPQSLRNRRSISPTGEEEEAEGKRSRYGSSSPDTTLSDPNFPVNQDNTPEISTSSAVYETLPADALTDLISHKLVPVIESIPGVGNVSRPPGSNPILELGHQSGQTSAVESGSQSPPNVGNQQGVEDPSSGCRIKSYEQTIIEDDSKNCRLMSISGMPCYAGKSHEELRWEYYGLKSGVKQNSVSNLKDVSHVTDGVLLEVEHCQKRVSSLENVVNNLRDRISGLQAELGKSSEGQVATGHKSCNSGIQIRSSPAADAEAPSGMRARSGPGSTSGKDDYAVSIAAGDGLSAANTDRNKATAEPRGQKPLKFDSIVNSITMIFTVVRFLFTLYIQRTHFDAVIVTLVVTAITLFAFIAYVWSQP